MNRGKGEPSRKRARMDVGGKALGKPVNAAGMPANFENDSEDEEIIDLNQDEDEDEDDDNLFLQGQADPTERNREAVPIISKEVESHLASTRRPEAPYNGESSRIGALNNANRQGGFPSNVRNSHKITIEDTEDSDADSTHSSEHNNDPKDQFWPLTEAQFGTGASQKRKRIGEEDGDIEDGDDASLAYLTMRKRQYPKMLDIQKRDHAEVRKLGEKGLFGIALTRFRMLMDELDLIDRVLFDKYTDRTKPKKQPAIQLKFQDFVFDAAKEPRRVWRLMNGLEETQHPWGASSFKKSKMPNDGFAFLVTHNESHVKPIPHYGLLPGAPKLPMNTLDQRKRAIRQETRPTKKNRAPFVSVSVDRHDFITRQISECLIEAEKQNRPVCGVQMHAVNLNVRHDDDMPILDAEIEIGYYENEKVAKKWKKKLLLPGSVSLNQLVGTYCRPGMMKWIAEKYGRTQWSWSEDILMRDCREHETARLEGRPVGWYMGCKCCGIKG